MTVCIISGSTLGGAEYVAEHLQQCLETQGFSTALWHGPDLAEVVDHDLWLVVTSTHGSGELPDNLQPLFDQIAATDVDFSAKQFAVVGLGNSDYDTFCAAADQVSADLKAKKAIEISDVLKIDVLKTDDPESAAEQWLPTFIAALKS